MHLFSDMDPNKILVWLQTSTRRNPQRTIDSIELSDIGRRFVVVADRHERQFPQDYAALQQWWARSWHEMAEAARLRGCRWLLRLEDDIEVNRHILANVSTWRAPASPRFGLGLLHVPNRSLPTKRDPISEEPYYNTPDVPGAQAQLLHVDLMKPVFEQLTVKHACFDISLSRAVWALDKRVFVHNPTLVRLHEASLTSSLELPERLTVQRTGDLFRPNWRREEPPASPRAGASPRRRAPIPTPSPPRRSPRSQPPFPL